MSTLSWKCCICGLWNSIVRYNCQACFFGHKIQRKTSKTQKLLAGYRKLTKESQLFKQHIICGYGKRFISSFIPFDIINLIKTFYDEVKYWNINTEDVIQVEIDPKNDSRDDPDHILYHDVTYMKGVKLQCSFNPNARYYEQTGFCGIFLRGFIPNYVEEIVIFFELFCNEIHGQWKSKIYWIKPLKYIGQKWSDTSDKETEEIDELDDVEWTDYEKHAMIMKCDDFETLFFGYTIDIISIRYNNNTLGYSKQIKMKKELHFIWNIDKSLIDRFAESVGNTQFLSDTFDSINNNWGLALMPNGSRRRKDKIILVEIVSYKMPRKIYSVEVEFVISNSFTKHITRDTLWIRYRSNRGIKLDELFPKHLLSKINSLTIELTIKILSIKYESRSTTDDSLNCISSKSPDKWLECGIID